MTKVCYEVDEMELWHLDLVFAEFMLPRITAYIEQYGSEDGPSDLKESWLITLKKIERALCLIIRDYNITELRESEKLEVEEGLRLYGENIRNMWN